jgi:hypothetical protein
MINPQPGLEERVQERTHTHSASSNEQRLAAVVRHTRAAPDPDYAEARYFAGLVALTSEW